MVGYPILFGRRRRHTRDLWSCLDFDAMTGSVVDAARPNEILV